MRLSSVFSYASLFIVGTFVGWLGTNSHSSTTKASLSEIKQNHLFESTLKSASEQATKDAIKLINSLSPEAELTSFGLGPAGTWVIQAKINKENRQFFMLSDKEHLIEGNIYSLYITEEKTTNLKDTDKENNERKLQSEQLKAEFLAKVAQKNNQDTELKTTQESNVQHIPKTAFKLPELNSVLSQDDKSTLLNKTKELEYIEVGEPNAPLVYVYFDFNCGGCRLTKLELAKYTSTGQLRVRYIPVGVITKESAIKAAYSLIPEKNEDRKILLDYFVQDGTAEELIRKKAPKDEVMKALDYVRKSNETFFFTPKKLTPTFIFELNNEVVIANLTSEKSIKSLVDRMNK